MSKLKNYSCAHCGHRFEAEERDGLECPLCFWSTSIKKEEDTTGREGGGGGVLEKVRKRGSAPRSATGMAFDWKRLQAVMGGVFFLSAGLILFFGSWHCLGPRFFPRAKNAPETSVEKKPVFQEKKIPFSAGELTDREWEILNRSVTAGEDNLPTAAEQKILKNAVIFKTGLVERLPSQAWSLDQFKEMIGEQEKFYKIPLPRSYKKELEKGFRENYVPAAEAFQKGDLLGARNFWVKSLIFPVYGGDLRKHRGVILTMLRSFVNDTLSKIGALNNALVEQNFRDREGEISREYQQFLGLLEQNAWDRAFEKAELLENKIVAMEQDQVPSIKAPAYPPEVAQVDRDIQTTLFELLELPAPARADLDPMKQDIGVKKQVISRFLPEKLGQMRLLYEAAHRMILQEKWAAAAAELEKITFPPALAEDARAKTEILKKLEKQTLDSVPESG